GRTEDRLHCAREGAGEEEASATHRWLYTRTTILSRVCACMAQCVTSGVSANASQDRRPRAAQLAGERTAIEHTRVRASVRLQGRRPDGAAAGDSRADLVTAGTRTSVATRSVLQERGQAGAQVAQPRPRTIHWLTGTAG